MPKQLILIADDEQDILDLYTTTFTQAGFEIITASNGNEAIEMAKQKHPAIILMDVKMPGMGGIDAVLELKNDPDMTGTKIVFITAFENPTIGLDVKIAAVLGKIEVIEKGISLKELVSKVKQLLTT